MAKNGKSKIKATKSFLKHGLLEGQIKKRHEVRAFQQKIKGRAVQRNKGGKKPEKDQEDSADEADIKLDALVESESEEGEEPVEGEVRSLFFPLSFESKRCTGMGRFSYVEDNTRCTSILVIGSGSPGITSYNAHRSELIQF